MFLKLYIFISIYNEGPHPIQLHRHEASLAIASLERIYVSPILAARKGRYVHIFLYPCINH